MKREEIKNEFEEKLNNIRVSDELFKSTMNKIRAKENPKKYFVPVWLKSCACVFLVGGLVALAYTNNQVANIEPIDNTKITENVEMQNSPKSISSEITVNEEATVKNKEIKTERNIDFSAPEAAQNDAKDNVEVYEKQELTKRAVINSDNIMMSVTGTALKMGDEEKIKIGDSKEKIFEEYEDVKEINGNYVVTIDNIEKTFVVSNGKIIEIY